MINKENIYLQINSESISSFDDLICQNNYGYEITDFCDNSIYQYGNTEKLDFWKDKMKSKNNVSMHGPFMNLNIHVYDNEIKEISRKKIQKSMEYCNAIKCNKIIFHVGLIPQASMLNIDKLINEHNTFWSELKQNYPNIDICLENVWETNTEFFEKLFSINNDVSMCFDIAHSIIYGKIYWKEWINIIGERIHHVHLSNNNLIDDLHISLCDGDINMRSVINYINSKIKDISYLIEVPNYDQVISSIIYLEENNIIKNRLTTAST